jgi:excisionase family DNA binding protein
MSLTTPDLSCLSATANPDELLEKPETARRLKKSQRTLDSWMREGRLPYFKVGKSVLFRWADVVDHLQRNCRIN